MYRPEDIKRLSRRPELYGHQLSHDKGHRVLVTPRLPS